MSDESYKKRMADNEAVFRHYNERVRENFDEIIKLAHESGQDDLIRDDDTPLHFYCECSDENCQQRIPLKPSAYENIHKNRMRFILIPGHENTDIEQIIKRRLSHTVVEKFIKPSDSARTLKPTLVDNS